MASSSSSSSSPKPSEHKPGEGKDELKEEKKDAGFFLTRINGILEAATLTLVSTEEKALLNKMNTLVSEYTKYTLLDEDSKKYQESVFDAEALKFQLEKLETTEKAERNPGFQKVLKAVLVEVGSIVLPERKKALDEALRDLSLQMAMYDSITGTSTKDTNLKIELLEEIKRNLVQHQKKVVDPILLAQLKVYEDRLTKNPSLKIPPVKLGPREEKTQAIFNALQVLEVDYINTNLTGSLFSRSDVLPMHKKAVLTLFAKGLEGLKKFLEAQLTEFAKVPKHKVESKDIEGTLKYLKKESGHHFAKQQALLLAYVYDALGQTRPQILNELAVQIKSSSGVKAYPKMLEELEPERKASLGKTLR